MKLMYRAALLAAPLCLAFAAPAVAQNSPFSSGDYVTVASISVDDGHSVDYATYLAGRWKAQQEFAKSQGWIIGYEVLANVNKRPGEPDLYLITRRHTVPDAAESEKQGQAMRDHFKEDDKVSDAASGERAKYRKQMGSMLLRAQIFK